MIKILSVIWIHNIEFGFNSNPETNAVMLLKPSISFEVGQSPAMGGNKHSDSWKCALF